MSPKRSLLITELLGNLPPPPQPGVFAHRSLRSAAHRGLSQPPRPTCSGTAPAPLGAHLRGTCCRARTARCRGSARGPHRRTAQPAIPARFPPGPVPLPSRSPRRAQVRRSRPGPAAHRRPRGCASSARLAPAAAEPRARFPQPPLPGRPRAPQPIGAASGGARLGLGPAARGGAAWRLRAEPRTALSDGLGAAPGRIASRPEPRGQHPSRGSAATFARTLGRNSDTSNRRSSPNVARKTAALLTRQFLITEENKALERFTAKKCTMSNREMLK